MTTTEQRLVVEPLSGWTGASIHGVDLSRPLSDEEIAAIRDALLRWKVVFFRDQDLDHDQHLRFARYFGGAPTPRAPTFRFDPGPGLSDDLPDLP